MPETDLYRLIYFSRATSEISLDELEDILKVACEKNPKLEVTGLLLCEAGHFMQVLEGPRKNVKDLFRSIREDDRHSKALTILEGEIAERKFSQWSMAHHQIKSDEPELREGFLQLMSDYETPENFQQDVEFLFQYLQQFRALLLSET